MRTVELFSIHFWYSQILKFFTDIKLQMSQGRNNGIAFKSNIIILYQIINAIRRLMLLYTLLHKIKSRYYQCDNKRATTVKGDVQ